MRIIANNRLTTQADLGRAGRMARGAAATLLSELPAHTLLKDKDRGFGDDWLTDDSSGDYTANSLALLRALGPWLAFGDFQEILELGWTLGGIFDATDYFSELFYGDITPASDDELETFKTSLPPKILEMIEDLAWG